MAERPEAEQSTTLVAELSREIVKLHARSYGRGPTKARSYLQPEFALTVLEDVFTTAERTLIATGSSDQVREIRQRFQDAMETELVAIVERTTGRRVRAFLSEVDTDSDVACELFLFEKQAPPRG